jgi:hypothetical protein
VFLDRHEHEDDRADCDQAPRTALIASKAAALKVAMLVRFMLPSLTVTPPQPVQGATLVILLRCGCAGAAHRQKRRASRDV